MLETIISLLIAVLPPCPTDEAIGTCAWDAAQQGNGVGTSFVVIDDQIIYSE